MPAPVTMTQVQLFTKEAAAGRGDPLNGLSGAPCIVGSYVVGVVRAHPVKEELIGTNYTVRKWICRKFH